MAKTETVDVVLTLEQVKELLEDGMVKVKGKRILMKDQEEEIDDWQDIISVAEDAITEIEEGDTDDDDDDSFEEDEEDDFEEDDEEEEEEEEEDEEEEEEERPRKR